MEVRFGGAPAYDAVSRAFLDEARQVFGGGSAVGATTSAANQPVRDTVTVSPELTELRKRARDILVEMKAELEERTAAAGAAGPAAPAHGAGAGKGVQDLLDEQFDHGVSAYEGKYKQRMRTAEPYLTESDKSMLSLLYEKYEKKYGEVAWEMRKVDRFAGELATLRAMGVLVQSDEARQAEKERAARRAERTERLTQEKAGERERDESQRVGQAADPAVGAAPETVDALDARAPADRELADVP